MTEGSRLRRASAFVVIGGFACAIAIACGEALTFESGEDGGDSGVVVARDDAGRTCECLPEVPAGWTGPIVIDELADCAAPWGVEEGRVYADFDGGAHDCKCACDSLPVACLFQQNNQPLCDNASCGSPSPVPPNCFPKTAGCSGYFRISVDGGGCAPNPTTRIDDAGFGRVARRCGTGEPVPRGVCPGAPGSPCALPAPPTAAHCIVHEGELPCPPSYPATRTYHASRADTRGCSPCSCTETAKPCEVGLFGEDTCATKLATATNGQCLSYGGITHHKLLRDASACEPKGGEKTGEASPTGPVAVCCRPAK